MLLGVEIPSSETFDMRLLADPSQSSVFTVTTLRDLGQKKNRSTLGLGVEGAVGDDLCGSISALYRSYTGIADGVSSMWLRGAPALARNHLDDNSATMRIACLAHACCTCRCTCLHLAGWVERAVRVNGLRVPALDGLVAPRTDTRRDENVELLAVLLGLS